MFILSPMKNAFNRCIMSSSFCVAVFYHFLHRGRGSLDVVESCNVNAALLKFFFNFFETERRVDCKIKCEVVGHFQLIDGTSLEHSCRCN